MKVLLPFACAALLLTGCAKESIAPQPATGIAKQQNSYEDDYNRDPEGTGRINGAADANRIAASRSVYGDNGPLSGSGPSQDDPWATPDDFNPGFGIGGGVDYGPGLTLPHSYSFTTEGELAFERDMATTKASAQAHLDATPASDEKGVLYWTGYLEGLDQYLSI